MSSNQDRSDVNYRPMWWLCGTGFALFVIGLFIVIVSFHSRAPWAWVEVGAFVGLLPAFPVAIIPGALLATEHPWGATFRVLVERHYAHPRLVGLAMMWDGLVIVGGIGVYLFVPGLLSAPPYLPITACLFALIPLVALALFDRRR